MIISEVHDQQVLVFHVERAHGRGQDPAVFAIIVERQSLGLVDECLDRLLDLLENGRLQDVLEFALEADTFGLAIGIPLPLIK